ncbi:MAG: ExbD/TolR family protein [Desulfohalobiaceae bacterium]
MALQVQRKGFVSEINVVPFVDVMLVLLVIFMVTAPLMTQGVDVDLPQTKTVETLPEDSDHLMLTVKRDGGIFLDEYEVKREDLGRQLKRLVKDKGKLLYLRADREASYGLVVEIMAEAKEAGISRLGVVAEPEEE